MKPYLIKYLGLFEGGVLTLWGLFHEKNEYQFTFYYDDTNFVLTFEDDFMPHIEENFEGSENYKILVSIILKTIIPLEEARNNLTSVDLSDLLPKNDS